MKLLVFIVLICSFDFLCADVTQEKFQKYIQDAKKGDAVAQRKLAAIYLRGTIVEQDIKQVLYWLEKSATQGNAKTQYQLASIYDHYNISHIDDQQKRAIIWYKKAAKQGYIEAMYALGFCYDYPVIEPVKAFSWFEQAAKRGHIEAHYQLGIHYSAGKRVEPDLKQAFNWFEKAAKLGHKRSGYLLGMCYYKGEGTPKDLQKAKKWLKQSVDVGYLDIEKFKQLWN